MISMRGIILPYIKIVMETAMDIEAKPSHYFILNRVIIMRKVLALSLIISISLMLFACGSEPMSAPDDSVANEAVDATELTKKTTVTTAATDSTAPEATAELQSKDWRTAYLDVLESQKDYHVGYALVYIDEDDIPELYLNGDCEATGDALFTYKNGQVIEHRLRRTMGATYIPRAGLIKNTNGNMGYYTTDIYRLTDSGFECIWSGLEVQEAIPPENENGDVSFASTFSIGNQTVSEEEYNAAIETIFNTSEAERPHENAVSYDAIVQLLLES